MERGGSPYWHSAHLPRTSITGRSAAKPVALAAARTPVDSVSLSTCTALPQLSQISRQFQACEGKVVSITRHTANPLRAHADASLVVSAHDPAPHVEALLYRSSLQYLLDFLFVLLCQANPDRHRQLGINLERIRHLLDT